MAWTILDFGGYKGKTLPQVAFADPDWFFWAFEEADLFRKRGLQRQAEKLYARATAIKVPQDGDEELVAEYGWQRGRFCNLEVVPKSRPPHAGSTATMRKDVFDMRFPKSLASYDKLGCRLLVKSLKYYLFGDGKCRMTRKRCEDFFDDDSNFDL